MLTLATAVIHITYSFPTAMFIASGAGYLVLLAAFFLPQLAGLRRLVGAALALFAIANIGAWYLIGARIPLAYVNKIGEVALVAAVAVYLVGSRRASQPVKLAPSARR